MIKTRLIQLLSHAKKYIVYQIIWKWLSLLCQVVMVYAACRLLESVLLGNVIAHHMLICAATVLAAIFMRFCCDRQAAYASYEASVVLLVCVPMIPISIVAVQKFAKKLLHN